MPDENANQRQAKLSYLLLAAILCAMAGGMGWGIRGQYGHETGAMIAGVLIGFTVVLFFLPRATSLAAARVVALTAIGISFGGSMTYGQTVGLTHDPILTGNWQALLWGLLGLSVKGGIWIGFAGAFMGMGLSGKQYRPLEMAMLIPTLLVLLCAGIWALNQPFDPANHILSAVYFSADWYWMPNAEFRPRPENWGGLLFMLIGLAVYLGAIRKDRLARNMVLAGLIAGGLGFPCGQCIQAFHAWNRDLFETGALAGFQQYLQHINWWNMMEITFGAIAGFVLAIGVWLNRDLIAANEDGDNDLVEIPAGWEWVLAATYVMFMVGDEFLELPMLFFFQSFGLILCAVPLVGVTGGRYWPYLMALPLVAVPIAGKTLRNLAYEHSELTPLAGWMGLVAVPLALALIAAAWLARNGQRGQTSRQCARIGLLLAAWLYFGLNFTFFRNPWPWTEWTGRTPSGIIFAVCLVCLTLAAVAFPSRSATDK